MSGCMRVSGDGCGPYFAATKRPSLPKITTEMTLHVLAYNFTRVLNIMCTQPLMAAIMA
jgi:hypothetical protein